MRFCLVIMLLGVLGGCGSPPGPAPAPVLPRASFGAVWAPPSPGAAPSGSSSVSGSPTPGLPVSGAGPGSVAPVSTGWEVTVYYTAVERFHHGKPEAVTGCRVLDCAHGDDALGSYPADFVAAVREEGTGRTNTGRYLNWSYDVGFWLDRAARDTHGDPLRAFVSAAADPKLLPPGTTFRITGCGTGASAEVCAALRRGRWTVTDEFTPGLGGSRHLDAYIGEETGPGFTGSAWYVTLTGASVRRS